MGRKRKPGGALPYRWHGFVVHETDDVMLMTNTRQSVRIPVNQIREAGRATQGVKLISLREGELLQDIARVINDGDEPAAGETPVESEAPPAEDGTAPEQT